MLTDAAGLWGDAPSRAVAAFTVVTLEFAEGILLGASRAGEPVLLSISHSDVRFHGGLAPLAAACLMLAHDADVPVGLHLDHCEDADLVLEAAALGFGSVMFDGSTLPEEWSVAETARVTSLAHDHGIVIEAAFAHQDDPARAAAFVAETDVDALAVGPTTDLVFIEQLASAVGVPLVLEHSDDFGDDYLRAAISAGIRKVNIGGPISAAYAEAMQVGLASRAGDDPRSAISQARESIAQTVERLLGVIAA